MGSSPIHLKINDVILQMKEELENSIETATVKGNPLNSKGVPYENGRQAKEAFIRSQGLIQHVHEFIKSELIKHGVNPSKIYPPFGQNKPELKITGLIKQKDQDVCVQPTNIGQIRERVSWGPLAYENTFDNYGRELNEQTLVINVRSQMSSLAKNADTLFERTFAEAVNLHELYPKICLGDVYMIPVREYSDDDMLQNKVSFKKNITNIAKYVSFFNYISDRTDYSKDPNTYEKCALLIVDFSLDQPKLYNTTDELKADNLVPQDFPIKLEQISIRNFVRDLLDVYKDRFHNEDIYL